MADMKKRVDDLLDEISRLQTEKRLLEQERDLLLVELGREVVA